MPVQFFDPQNTALTVSSSAPRRSAFLASVLGIALLGALFTAPLLHSQQKDSSASKASPSAESSSGMGIEIHGGYPELHVDGQPFFIHSAAFFYYRTPRDLWNKSLDRYRALGINTIDIYIPWNWHEPAEGQFDFDGHTNSRRDLRGLMRLVSDKNLKLIARPGPLILNEWRYGGYPGWLLAKPEYDAPEKMDRLDLLEGRYPPLAALNARDAEAAAAAWLANPTHMEKSRAWLAAVARELAPYAANKVASASLAKDAKPAAEPPNHPLLFVQLEDDLAIGRTNHVGANFWRYLDSLRDALHSGGLDMPVFINPTNPRVAAAGSALPQPIATMGQWYLPPADPAATYPREITSKDSAAIELLADELNVQPAFPPALIEYQAGWYAPADDDRPAPSSPWNTLVSSRLFLAHGLHGLSYFPLQDSVTPAGYSVPWANQNYLWDSALDASTIEQARAAAVERNGEFLKRWGSLLAASHKRADFAISSPPAAAPDSALHVSETIEKIDRLAQLNHFSSELLDPEIQPVDELLRDPLIFLPTLSSSGGLAGGSDTAAQPFSHKAQQSLVEYVRRGGTLFIFPSRPPGSDLAQLWSAAPPPEPAHSNNVATSWKFGDGRVMESSKDFISWLDLKRSYDETAKDQRAAYAMRSLGEVVATAGIRPAVRVTHDSPEASDLVLTELVSNEGTQSLGARTGGTGWLSVTNLNSEGALDVPLDALAPSASSRGDASDRSAFTPLTVSIPAKESLLLPLNIPLCAAEEKSSPCTDAVVAAGADFLGAAREGKVLELAFYGPSRAQVRLHLERQASRAEINGATYDTHWDEKIHELSVTIPRGVSPRFRRLLKITLPYTPRVPQVPHAPENFPGDFELSATNAVRLSIGQDTYLESFPPLILVDPDHGGRVVFEGSNKGPTRTRDVDFNITGAFRGSTSLRVRPQQIAVSEAKLKPASDANTGGPPKPGADGLLRGEIEIRREHEREKTPVVFVPVREGAVSAYRFDFDRDGADEWALENTGLRLIVSPESGGRAIALVDKATGLNLLTSVGGFRDNFSYTPNPSVISPERARGRYGLFNRAYAAEWHPDGANTALMLRYRAPDIYPGGAEIEKSIELGDPGTFQVSYRVALIQPASPSESAENPSQSFVSVNSFPAFAEGGRHTVFCWSEAASKAESTTEEKGAKTEDAAEPCEDFTPGGPAFELPIAVRHLEIRTAGRPGMSLEWELGRMIIEPKRFSALLNLKFPPLIPGGADLRATLHFHVLPAE